MTRLLVRGPNWIGDAVMCEPAIASLRLLFPAAEIALLVRPAVAELFRGHPGIDRLLVYQNRGQHAGFMGKWRLSRTLRQSRFQMALLFQNAFEAAWLAVLAGIPTRYGYATDGRGWLLTHPVPVSDHRTHVHQVQYYWNLLRSLGAGEVPESPRLYLSHDEERRMALKLTEAGMSANDFLIGVNPGSMYGAAKRWLPERYAEVTDRLIDHAKNDLGRTARAVIVGARGEEALGRAVADRMRHPALVFSGGTTIRELMAIIRRCGLFLTNDTGPMHIAAAFQVPLVAVFGPTDVRTTAPFGEGHALVRHAVECAPCLLRECPIDHRCMTGVSSDMVYEAAIARMNVDAAADPQSGGAQSGPVDDNPCPPPESDALRGITVFLDRDGTINRDTGYVRSPDELELFPGVVEGIARLKQAGANVVVVTNQSGLARGLVESAGLEAIHAKLRRLLEKGGASLDAIYFCPHHPEEACSCRKPQTAMIERAAAQLKLDPAGYYVVGDQRRDIELGRRVGARTVLVTTGPASAEYLATLQSTEQTPDCVAAGLGEAVDWIFEDVRNRRQAEPGIRESHAFPPC
jgi:heptosyltransferase-2